MLFYALKQMDKSYDLLLKLLLVGDEDVGKTCVLARYAEATFNSTYIATQGELS